jgi:hypothetical protein
MSSSAAMVLIVIGTAIIMLPALVGRLDASTRPGAHRGDKPGTRAAVSRLR